MIQFSIQGRIGFSIQYGSIHLSPGGVFLFLHSNLSSIVLCVACWIRKGPSFLLALLFSEGWRLGFSKPTGQLSLPASSSRQSMLNPLYLQFAASVDSCPRSGVVHGVVGPQRLGSTHPPSSSSSWPSSVSSSQERRRRLEECPSNRRFDRKRKEIDGMQ